jgi:glutamate/aspartate transport system permease protein
MFANLDFDVIRRSLPYLFLDGMTFTLMLTGLAALGGLVFGTLIALMRLSSYRLLGRIAGLYVDFMRSLPLVLVIFWFYFLVPYIGQWITGAERPIPVGYFTSSLVTFTLFEAAYFCEIMRAGIQSIPRGNQLRLTMVNVTQETRCVLAVLRHNSFEEVAISLEVAFVSYLGGYPGSACLPEGPETAELAGGLS